MAKEVCKICEEKLGTLRLLVAHVRHKHKIFSKEYYDRFLKKADEGICKNSCCKNQTKFVDVSVGYQKFCSTKCMANDIDIQLKKKKTCFKNYGVEFTSSLPEYKRKQRELITKKNNDPEFKKMVIEMLKSRTFSITTRLKMSASTKKRCNDPLSYFNSKEFRELLRNQMLNGGAVHANSFVRNPSGPQTKTYENAKLLYEDAVLNYPVKVSNRKWYSLDIAILSIKVVIEYDETYWHKGREEFDKKRDEELRGLGWKVIRYRDYIPTKEQLRNDINFIMKEN